VAAKCLSVTLFCVTVLGVVPFAEAQIAGVPVSCFDFRGLPVALVPAPGLQDVGMARIVNNQPVIFLNPQVLGAQPREMQLFWYAHECAHHVRGHLANLAITNEADADCWAVKTGRNQGWFPPQAFQFLVQTLGSSPGSVWGHLPGPARIGNMWSCYSQP
jgi:hypothetical protein